jgi:hypothetical protein
VTIDAGSVTGKVWVTVEARRVPATVCMLVNVDVAAGAVTVMIGPCAPAQTSSVPHSRKSATLANLRDHILLVQMAIDISGMR